MEEREVVACDGFRTFPSRKMTVTKEPPVKQAPAEDLDVNKIMMRYAKTGVVPTILEAGVFSDVAEIGDFREALDRVRVAEEAFMTVDPVLRLRFRNDPLAFVEFVIDPKNKDELIALGLMKKPAPVPEKSASDRLAELELGRREAAAAAAAAAARAAPAGA